MALLEHCLRLRTSQASSEIGLRPTPNGPGEQARGCSYRHVFLMYRASRLVVLMHIRNTLRHRTGAKRRPRQSRRPSAAKSIIRAKVPKDTGPVYLQASFFGATPTGQRLDPLDLFARLLIKGGVAEVDIAVPASMGVALLPNVAVHYTSFVHSESPFCGPGPEEGCSSCGAISLS
jgi:hypothetical protein